MILYILLVPVVCLLLMLLLLHIGFIPPRIKSDKTPKEFAMDYQSVDIVSANNKHLLAWLIPVENQKEHTVPLVIIVHGWGSCSALMLPIARVFHKEGSHVLLFDSRCHGQSDGDTYSALPRFAEDLDHTIEYAKQSLSFNGNIILLGHSVGAGAVLYSASKRNDIAAVISISAFGSPQWLMTRYFENFKLPKPFIHFLLAYIQWIIGHRFSEIAPVNTIQKISIPVLLVHGTHDNTVPIEDAYAIQENHKGHLLIIEGADHDSVEKIETDGQQLIDFLKQEHLL